MKICFFTENYYKGGLDTFLSNLINVWPIAWFKELGAKVAGIALGPMAL